MKISKKAKLCAASAFAVLTFASSAFAAASDFETQEYLNSTGLWVINASTAYDKGFTGEGITLGVMDVGTNVNHYEFEGKDAVFIPYDDNAYDWNEITHGSHVAGIIAASKDGADIENNMHGVAYDASLVALGLDEENIESRDELWEQASSLLTTLMDQYPEVKIINNSWGQDTDVAGILYTYYVLGETDDTSEEELKSIVTDAVNDAVTATVPDKLLENDIVMVISASNEGSFGPGMPAGLRTVMPQLTNWISVISLDCTDGKISADGDGNKALTSGALSPFSNLALGAEFYSICAPGSFINSVKASGGYMSKSGTSMAAPYVTGAMGLVQQAFPWMSARNLVDTVLSTADRDFSAPEYVVTVSKYEDTDEETGGTRTTFSIRLSYIDSEEGFQDRVMELQTMPDIDSAEGQKIVEALAIYYKENSAALLSNFGISDAATFVAFFFADEDNPYTYIFEDGTVSVYYGGGIWSVPIDQIFGQGILDVGKAVDGISVLDANRMTPDDFASSEIQEYTGKEELLYPLDTQNYTATLSNDISQELWHEARHQYLMEEYVDLEAYEKMGEQTSVGLIKSGSGTLYLTGTNSYEGSTVISEGALSVTPRSDGTGGVLTSSDVYVLPEAKLQGTGTINKAVYNYGTVAPGNSIGTLTVGNYSSYSDSVLEIEFAQDGSHDVLAVTGSEAVAVEEMNVIPYGDYDGSAMSWALTDIIDTTADITVNSYTTTAALDVTGDGETVEINHPDDGFSRNGTTPGSAAAGTALDKAVSSAQSNADAQALYSTLFQLGAEELDTVMNSLHAEPYDVLMISALNRSQTLTGLVESRFFSKEELPKEWEWFVMPFGSKVRQDGWSNYGSYKSEMYGVMLGGEKRKGDWITGIHFGFVHDETRVSAGSYLSSESDGGFIGIHGRKAKNFEEGFFLFGQLRAAWDSSDARRTGYGEYGSSFNGFTGTAQIGAGWNNKKGNRTITPIAALDYTYLHRSGFDENGNIAKLYVGSTDYESLRSSLGASVSFADKKKDNGIRWNADFSILWRHEFMDDLGSDWSLLGACVPSIWRGAGSDDWVDLTAGASFSDKGSFTSRFELGTSIFRSGYDGFRSALKLEWKF